MHEFRTTRRIEFADTDMAGIVHFARFFVFMETAEHQFLRSLGTPVHFIHDGQEIGWPRVKATCEYHNPARLGDELQILVRVRRKGRRSMTYGFEFRREDGAERTLIAEGEVTSICCVVGAGRLREEPVPLRSTPIPAFIADQLDEFPTPVAAGRGD